MRSSETLYSVLRLFLLFIKEGGVSMFEEENIKDNKEVYEKPLVIEYDSPTVSFTTAWDKSGYSS